MSEEAKKEESQNQPPGITPAEAEKRVSSAVAEVVPETPDGLLIEEDGDPFWVIQRVVWGILKTAALLVFLIFLIWIVWRPSSFLGNDTSQDFVFEPEPPQESQIEEIESKPWWQRLFSGEDTSEVNAPLESEPTVNPVPEPSPTPNIPNQNLESTDPVAIAYELETARVLLVRGIIPESVQWLREAKTIGDLSMQMLRQGTPQARSRQVEEILAASDELFIQSINLRSQLQTELNYFLEEGNKANATTAQLEQSIAQALAALDPVPVDSLVADKIASQQNASFFMSNAKIRDTLIRNIQTFDRLLQQRAIPLLNPAMEIRAN